MISHSEILVRFEHDEYVPLYSTIKPVLHKHNVASEGSSIFPKNRQESCLCLQSDAAMVRCFFQLLAHCACLYLGSSPSLEWQRQAGFWCQCSFGCNGCQLRRTILQA